MFWIAIYLLIPAPSTACFNGSLSCRSGILSGNDNCRFSTSIGGNSTFIGEFSSKLICAANWAVVVAWEARRSDVNFISTSQNYYKNVRGSKIDSSFLDLLVAEWYWANYNVAYKMRRTRVWAGLIKTENKSAEDFVNIFSNSLNRTNKTKLALEWSGCWVW